MGGIPPSAIGRFFLGRDSSSIDCGGTSRGRVSGGKPLPLTTKYLGNMVLRQFWLNTVRQESWLLSHASRLTFPCAFISTDILPLSLHGARSGGGHCPSRA